MRTNQKHKIEPVLDKKRRTGSSMGSPIIVSRNHNLERNGSSRTSSLEDVEVQRRHSTQKQSISTALDSHQPRNLVKANQTAAYKTSKKSAGLNKSPASRSGTSASQTSLQGRLINSLSTNMRRCSDEIIQPVLSNSNSYSLGAHFQKMASKYGQKPREQNQTELKAILFARSSALKKRRIERQNSLSSDQEGYSSYASIPFKDTYQNSGRGYAKPTLKSLNQPSNTVVKSKGQQMIPISSIPGGKVDLFEADESFLSDSSKQLMLSGSKNFRNMLSMKQESPQDSSTFSSDASFAVKSDNEPENVNTPSPQTKKLRPSVWQGVPQEVPKFIVTNVEDETPQAEPYEDEQSPEKMLPKPATDPLSFNERQPRPKSSLDIKHVSPIKNSLSKTKFNNIDEVLEFLLQEEELLYKYASLSADGQFTEINNKFLPYKCVELYSDLFNLVPVSKQRPKVFALQLNIYIIVITFVVEVFVQHPPLMRKFASKLEEVFLHCHQNFLHLVDLILEFAQVDPSHFNYQILKKLTQKKLRLNEKMARLNSIRQNNEMTRVSLRKLGLFLTSSEQAAEITDFGLEILEAVRISADETSIVLGNEREESNLVLDCLTRLEVKVGDAIKFQKPTVMQRTRSAIKIRATEEEEIQVLDATPVVKKGVYSSPPVTQKLHVVEETLANHEESPYKSPIVAKGFNQSGSVVKGFGQRHSSAKRGSNLKSSPIISVPEARQGRQQRKNNTEAAQGETLKKVKIPQEKKQEVVQRVIKLASLERQLSKSNSSSSLGSTQAFNLPETQAFIMKQSQNQTQKTIKGKQEEPVNNYLEQKKLIQSFQQRKVQLDEQEKKQGAQQKKLQKYQKSYSKTNKSVPETPSTTSTTSTKKKIQRMGSTELKVAQEPYVHQPKAGLVGSHVGPGKAMMASVRTGIGSGIKNIKKGAPLGIGSQTQKEVQSLDLRRATERVQAKNVKAQKKPRVTAAPNLISHAASLEQNLKRTNTLKVEPRLQVLKEKKSGFLARATQQIKETPQMSKEAIPKESAQTSSSGTNSLSQKYKHLYKTKKEISVSHQKNTALYQDNDNNEIPQKIYGTISRPTHTSLNNAASQQVQISDRQLQEEMHSHPFTMMGAIITGAQSVKRRGRSSRKQRVVSQAPSSQLSEVNDSQVTQQTQVCFQSGVIKKSRESLAVDFNTEDDRSMEIVGESRDSLEGLPKVKKPQLIQNQDTSEKDNQLLEQSAPPSIRQNSPILVEEQIKVPHQKTDSENISPASYNSESQQKSQQKLALKETQSEIKKTPQLMTVQKPFVPAHFDDEQTLKEEMSRQKKEREDDKLRRRVSMRETGNIQKPSQGGLSAMQNLLHEHIRRTETELGDTYSSHHSIGSSRDSSRKSSLNKFIDDAIEEVQLTNFATQIQQEQSKDEVEMVAGTQPSKKVEIVVEATESETVIPSKPVDSTDNEAKPVKHVPGVLASSHMIEDTSEEKNEEQKAIELELQQLRAQVTIPYLAPLPKEMDDVRVYTLVLDLDETLIHFEGPDTGSGVDIMDEDGYYLIRPGCIKFLTEMAKFYEIVVFTAAMPDYADWILNNIDSQGQFISHRLYRQHCSPHEDYAIKDLTKLGRDIRRTIIIDNLAENFQFTTPNNGIWVESWYEDMDDQVLPTLIPFLREIVVKDVQDVREILTPQIKEKTIYRCMDLNKPIPPVQDLLKQAAESQDKN